MRQDGDRVSLTIGTWVGILATLASVVVVPMLAMQGRMTAVEQKAEYNSKSIERIQGEMRATRGEILSEIKELRLDVKQLGNHG